MALVLDQDARAERAAREATDGEGPGTPPSLDAEQALRRYELIAELSRDIILFLRRGDGRILEANAAAVQAYGRTREELLALHVSDLRAPETAGLTEEQMEAAERGGILFETVHRRKDGTRFPVEVSSRGAIVDGERTLISVVRDITARRAAEQVLLRSRAQFQATVEGLSEGLLLSDLEGNLLHWNRAALDMHGFASLDEARRLVFEFAANYVLSTLDGCELRPDEWPIARIIRGERLRDVQLLVRRRTDGWTRVFSYGGEVVSDAEGRPLAILTVSDATERHRALAELAASEARLRTLAEAVPQLIWTADPDGRPDYFNERWRDYTGQAAGEESWEPATHPDDHARAMAFWREAVANQREFEVELRLRAANGGYRWFLRRAILVREPGAARSRWFGTCTDIHELVVSRELLRQADRLKDDFLAMASHELRTPLTALRLQQELMRRGLRGREPNPRTERQFAVMDAQIGRLSALVGVLLDASRITEGKLALAREEVDLAEVARAVVERLEPEGVERGAEIRLSGPPVLGRWDRARVDQVITNLLSNALKYGDGKPVEIQVGEDNGSAWLSVRDHGVGIPLESQGRIFDRFERAPNTTGAKGLGLGLWIARSLVEAHGGKLEVVSMPGQGATFTMVLPTHAPASRIA